MGKTTAVADAGGRSQERLAVPGPAADSTSQINGDCSEALSFGGGLSRSSR